MMVWQGRLPGVRALGCAGTSTKLAPRFCRQIPVSPATTPEPKLIDSNKLWMRETTLRSLSTQVTYTVLPNAVGFPGTYSLARSRVISHRRAAAYAFDSSPATGIVA